jgi:hypothetical protein
MECLGLIRLNTFLPCRVLTLCHAVKFSPSLSVLITGLTNEIPLEAGHQGLVYHILTPLSNSHYCILLSWVSPLTLGATLSRSLLYLTGYSF